MKAGVLIFESLKKRRLGIYRPVPVPPAFLDTLNTVHDLCAAQKRKDRGKGICLWNMARNTAWRNVCDVMEAAKIVGPHATPKGLRHGFGIKAVISGVPLNTLQKWLGHAQLSTTSIYPDAHQVAERMWD
jgi:integrase